MTTTVRIETKNWVHSYTTEPDEENPEGRFIQQDWWDTYLRIDGPGGTATGAQQLSGIGLNESSTDDDLVQATKAAWGGSDTWTLG